MDKIRVVRGDIRNSPLIERIINEYEIKTVFHLAAQTIVGVANRNPISTFETNIGGTWNLLEACRKNPLVEQIVVASSDKAYGDLEGAFYDETMPLRGVHPYDVSKSCADLIAQAYAETYNLPVVITRCGNLYGGGDLNWNRLIPGTIRSVLRGQSPVIRSDGKYIRDYFYVEDAVAAYVYLAECLMQNPSLKGEAFNFSNEQPQDVLSIVNKILYIMNSPLKPDIRNEVLFEIKSQNLNSAKARNILKWKPNFTLDHGLTLTIKWYKDFFADE